MIGSKQHNRRRPADGFTLIEVIVVISIIGILAALTMVAVQRSRAASDRAGCANNLKQIGQALHAHQVTWGVFPPQTPAPNNTLGSSFSRQGISWHVYILPHIEQNSFWSEVELAYNVNRDPMSAPHDVLRRTVVSSYVCPSDKRLISVRPDPQGLSGACTSYVGMTGHSDDFSCGVFGIDRTGTDPARIVDGLSNTVMVGERPPPASLSLGWWYTTHSFPGPEAVNDYEVPADGPGGDVGSVRCGTWPINWPGITHHSLNYFHDGSIGNECDALHYWSLHSGGANFLFGDGSVRFLTYGVAPHLRDLASVAGGEVWTD